MEKGSRPQLTISLLISNRMETIPRCLDSLRPIMDAIPSELILIDTSRNPEVHNLLLEYTDQVYEFEWCNDFAKARNEGLKRARGEWFMFLDDDEWFVETAEIIEFFRTGECYKHVCASYQVRNFLDTGYHYYDDSWVCRMVRLEEDTHFEGKVHEYFTPIRGSQIDLYAMIYHTGYIYKTQEERKAHFERNHILLQEVIREEPNNIWWWIQLAQEYSYAGEHEKLIEYCITCLEKIEGLDNHYVNTQRGVFYTGLVTGYIREKQYMECVETARRALDDNRSSWVLEGMMYLRLGEAYLFLGQIDEAEEQITKYFQMLESTDLNDANVKKALWVFLAGEVFSKNSQEIAYAILICCGLENGNTNALIDYYQKLGWSNPIAYTMEGVEKFFVNAMWSLSYEPIFSQIMVDAFSKQNLREAFRKTILSQKPQEMTIFQETVYTLANAMQRVIEGPKEDFIDYHCDLQKYVQATCQWYDFLEQQKELEWIGEEMPGYIQAAMDISDYMEFEFQNKIQALGKLKDAVENVPEFAVGIGNFLLSYEEFEKQRVAKQQNEMEELRTQIVGQVKAMLVEGQIQAATQIIEQLKQMFPGDAEIEALGE